MTPLFILAVIFPIQGILGAIFNNGRQPVILPVLPTKTQICEFDAFMASTPHNGKVFLFPWETRDQKGNWMKNRGLCAANCAEMVTIHSKAENEHFLNFMRDSIFTPGNFATWVGAQVNNKTFTSWTNGEPNDYNNPSVYYKEYNEDGVTCLNAGWGSISNNDWYNYYCDWDYYFVACQRPASWKISGL